jgi:hypothetical protein
MAFPSPSGPNSYIWNLKQVYNARLGNNWPTSGLGLFAGGYVAPGAVNVIDFINFVSTGNASDFGDLFTSVYVAGNAGVATRGIVAGGGAPTQTNVIQYFNLPSKGNSLDFGDLTVARFFVSNGNANNSTRALFAGGEAGAPANAIYNVIDFITIASLGNATDFGDESITVRSRAALASPTRAVFGGGRGPGGNTDVIDYVTIASAGDAADFGDLLNSTRYFSGLSSSVRGIFAGGLVGPSGFTGSNVIQFITIASTGNSTDFGDFTTNSSSNASCSDNVKGLTAISTSSSNVIEFITIASAGNATDFGDLTVGRTNLAGIGNQHGGTK